MAGFTPGSISKLLQDEIGDYLGTYTYKGGLVCPAIAIDTVPNDVKVKGFEAIIPGFPKLPKMTFRSCRRTHICQIWDVDFINHDSPKTGSLARKGEFFEMVQNLILVLPRTTQVIPFQQSDPVKSLQRVRVSIKLSDGYDNRRPSR